MADSGGVGGHGIEHPMISGFRSSSWLRWLVGLLAALAVLSAGASGVSADDGYQIRAQVKEQFRGESGKTDNQPVAGVLIVVTDSTGAEVGRAKTDDKGVATIPVPAKADYTVTLDESTLPDGQSLSDQTAAVQQVTTDSFITSTKVINFFTGEGQGGSQSFWEKIAQRSVNGIRLGLVLAMCSVGLSLIFGTTGLTNFAHGEMVTFGGLIAYLLNVTGFSALGFLAFLPGVHDDGSFHILIAAPLSIILGGAFGWALNAGIFQRLRKRGIGLVTQMVLTVGLSILLRNFFLSRFDSRTRPFKEFSLQKAWEIGPVTITPRDFTVSVLSLVILVTVALSLRFTRLGKATRAVSDNPDLASATGIDAERVVRLVWILGGMLAAAGGVFRGLDEQVSFDMGGRLLFLMFAGITLGGLGSAFGALVGGFVVGVLVEVASMVVPTELKTTPALLILILVLLFRPQGILGKSQRVG